MNQIKIKDGKFVVYPTEWNGFVVDNPDQSEYAGIVVLPYRNDIYVFTSMNPIEKMSNDRFDKVVACLGKEYPEIAEYLSGQGRSPEIYGIVSEKETYKIVKQAWIANGESL